MAAPTYRSSPTTSPPAQAHPSRGAPARLPRRRHHGRTRCPLPDQAPGLRGRAGIVRRRGGDRDGTDRDGTDRDGTDRDWHDDDPATIHVVGLADGVICGTVRLYPLGAGGRWKGDRLAVLAGQRHLGLGAPLVRFAVSSAGRLGGREMEAFIQPANVAFFRWLGWRRAGDLVDYAGVPHQRMLIDLRAGPG